MTEIEKAFDVTVVATQPFEGQKPGTSGLRKRVGFIKHFLNYPLQNEMRKIVK